MFDKIITWIKEVVNKMFNKDEINKAFNVDVAVSNKMSQAIKLWADMYINEAPWIDRENGIESLNLPASIASEFARMTTIEFKSEITGSVRANYLNDQYKKVKDELRKQVEFGNASGGLVFKPFVKNKEICVEYISQDSFIPTAFDSTGRLTGAIFISQILKGKYIYTRLEAHKYENNSELIQNKAYMSENASTLGTEVNLDSIEEWKDIAPFIPIENIDRPLFAYYKVPFANNIDPKSPLGVSVYARAVKDIKRADIQYGRLDWEYEASEKAIYADVGALKPKPVKDARGNTVYEMPKVKDRLFRTLDTGKDEFYEDYSPEIRDEAFIRGLNKDKQEIEFKCQLAYGTISDPQEVEKSATEIKTGKQRSYSSVADMQKSLQSALENLIYAMDVLSTLYNLVPAGKYEVGYEWDDSIIVDTQSEQVIRSQEVTQGLSSKKDYLMWRYGLTEEQALEKVKEIEAEKGPDNNMFSTE